MSFSNPVAIGVRPDFGTVVPGWLLEVVFAGIAVLLCFDRFGFGFPFFLGVALAGYTIVRPDALAAWGLILLLGTSQLAQAPSLGPRFLLLLAGLHALQVLATLLPVVSARTLVQLRYLGRILLRFFALELLVQAIAVLALWWFAGGSGSALPTVPILAAVGAAGIVGVVLLLVGARQMPVSSIRPEPVLAEPVSTQPVPAPPVSAPE